MNLVGKQVEHKKFGIGEIIEHTDNFIVVTFDNKVSKFQYPEAFENFIKAIDKGIQSYVMDILQNRKEIKELENRAVEEEKRKREEETKRKTITRPICDWSSAMNYMEVEERFKINRRGFGRGINVTRDSIVLISSMDKNTNCYRDGWLENGDYCYSGEGRFGDQFLDKGNLALLNAGRDGKDVHLLIKFSSQNYCYQGIFGVVDMREEVEPDERGILRREFKFILRKDDLDN